MRRLSLPLAALACAALFAREAAAFNPEPRPAPSGVDEVCADDTSLSCTPDSASGVCDSATCVGDPADLASPVAVRGTLTVIADEDVTGWNDGVDPSPTATRDANARFTLLLQYERDGVLRTFAEIYRLGRDCFGFDEFFPLPDGFPSLCVPAGGGWSQPASEEVITDPQFNIVFTIFGAEAAKAIAADLTGNPASTAKPYLDIVDRLPAASSSRAGADPLASVQQLKVTIRLAP
jgi:hypothetical protein